MESTFSNVYGLEITMKALEQSTYVEGTGKVQYKGEAMTGRLVE